MNKLLKDKEEQEDYIKRHPHTSSNTAKSLKETKKNIEKLEDKKRRQDNEKIIDDPDAPASEKARARLENEIPGVGKFRANKYLERRKESFPCWHPNTMCSQMTRGKVKRTLLHDTGSERCIRQWVFWAGQMQNGRCTGAVNLVADMKRSKR